MTAKEFLEHHGIPNMPTQIIGGRVKDTVDVMEAWIQYLIEQEELFEEQLKQDSDDREV